MIKFIHGNLFDHLKPNIVIPHVTNNSGTTFHAGFVAELNSRWPYKLGKRSPQYIYFNEKQTLGSIQIIEVEPSIKVINMCAQDNINPPYKGTRLVYSALVECMKQISGNIHCPMFGSGIARGHWPTIEKLIHELWSDVTVYKI